MMNKTDSNGELPSDLDAAIDQIHDLAVPLMKALEYVSKRAEAQDVSQPELGAWRTTRALLAAATKRYERVIAILRGGEPRDAGVEEGLDAQALSNNLRSLEQIVKGWKMLTTGKWNATNETAAIWNKVIAQAERLSSENQEMFNQFEAERRDLNTTGTRLQRALEYLWNNGRPPS